MVNWRDYVEQDAQVLCGKPVIKGTRLSVEFVRDLIAAGWTTSDILENYPRLRPEHIAAVALYEKRDF
jgi:uncharacterized protein (DUF433 family)